MGMRIYQLSARKRGERGYCVRFVCFLIGFVVKGFASRIGIRIMHHFDGLVRQVSIRLDFGASFVIYDW
jgi:hypothetical protein